MILIMCRSCTVDTAMEIPCRWRCRVPSIIKKFSLCHVSSLLVPINDGGKIKRGSLCLLLEGTFPTSIVNPIIVKNTDIKIHTHFPSSMAFSRVLFPQL